jgi:hypothetical protein
LTRSIEADLGRPIGVLIDLQRSKLQAGTSADGSFNLAAGAAFTLDLDRERPGDTTRATAAPVAVSRGRGHVSVKVKARMRSHSGDNCRATKHQLQGTVHQPSFTVNIGLPSCRLEEVPPEYRSIELDMCALTPAANS